jgi:DNA-binding transcriptional ArsR family regulator
MFPPILDRARFELTARRRSSSWSDSAASGSWVPIGNPCVTLGLVASPRAARDIDPFEALGDANRRTIVALLAERERSVVDLAAEMPISRPAVSRHLRVLKSAGLVTDVTRGTRHIYRLDAQGAEAVRVFLTEVWGDALTRFSLVTENVRPDPAGRMARKAGR